MNVVERVIGSVKILEFQRSLENRPADVCQELNQKTGRKGNVLVLLDDVLDMNEAKICDVFSQCPHPPKGAVVSSSEILRKFFARDGYQACSNLLEAAFYFENNFAEGESLRDPFVEKRREVRLNRIIPMEIKLNRDVEPRVTLYGVTRNISESGAFVQIVSRSSEFLIRKFVDPYELKMLDINLYADPGHFFELKGKVVHRNTELYGMGVEFYEYGKGSLDFLKQSLKTRS